MGIELSPNLPEAFLVKLPPAERRKATGVFVSKTPLSLKTEKALQRTVAEWLSARAIPFFSPRSDKRTTWQVGAPDFVVCLPRGEGEEGFGLFVCVECKCLATRGKLSPEQQAIMAKVTAAKGSYLVIHSIEELEKAFTLLAKT